MKRLFHLCVFMLLMACVTSCANRIPYSDYSTVPPAQSAPSPYFSPKCDYPYAVNRVETRVAMGGEIQNEVPIKETIRQALPQEVSIRQEKIVTPSPKDAGNDQRLVPVKNAVELKSLIVIDAGHGGDDFGTYSSKNAKYQEKMFTLATAYMVRNFLQDLGYKTIMTRKEDVFIALDERARMANKLQPDLFVSIHYNSAPSPQAEGIEIFYFRAKEGKNVTARSQESKNLGEAILSRMIATTQAKSRGVKHGNLAVVRETTMPAVLVEGGFLTNEGERDKIKDPAYLKQISWGIAKGIDDFLSAKAMIAKRGN